MSNDQPPYPPGQYPPGQYPGQYPPPQDPAGPYRPAAGENPAGPYQTPPQSPPAQNPPYQPPPGQHPAYQPPAYQNPAYQNPAYPSQPGQSQPGQSQPGQYPPGPYAQPDDQPTAQFATSPYGTGAQAGAPSGYADPWQGQQAGQPPSGGYGSPYGYQPGPPKKSRAGWWIGGAVLAVVLILVAVTVGVFALRGKSPNPLVPKTSTAKVLWRAPFTAASVAGDPIVAGVWTSDKAVVRGGGDGLHAYDINNGKELWNTPIPDSGTVCSMSPTTLLGVGALIYGQPGRFEAACDHLLAVDTSTGKQLWTADLTPVDTSARSSIGDRYTSVSLATGVVVIATSNVMRGYSTNDGTKLWGLVIKPSKPNTITTCHPINSLASGDRALIVVSCSGDSGYVTALTAQTGKELWEHDLTTTEGDPLFTDPISVRPAVLQSRVAAGDPKLLVLDDSNGTLTRTLAQVTSGVQLRFRSVGDRLSGAFRYPVVVQDGKLFAATADDFSSKESKVLGIDLSTGQPAWNVGGGDKSQLQVVSSDGHSVIAFDRGGFAHPPRLVRFDLSTGKRTEGQHFPASLSSDSFGRLVFVQGDKLILVSLHPSAASPPIVVAGKP